MSSSLSQSLKTSTPVIQIGGLSASSSRGALTVSELIVLLNDAVKIMPEVADYKIDPSLDNAHRIEIHRAISKVVIGS